MPRLTCDTVDRVIMEGVMERYSLSTISTQVVHTDIAFLSIFPYEYDPEEQSKTCMLLSSITLPGFYYVPVRSDMSEFTECTIKDVLGIPDVAEDDNPPTITEEVKSERLTGLLTAIFTACIYQSDIFLMPRITDMTDLNHRVTEFYERVQEQVVSVGISGGGFLPKTDDPEMDALNPGNIDDLEVECVEEIIVHLTLTRIYNADIFSVLPNAPDTALTRLVDDWIVLVLAIRAFFMNDVVMSDV